MSPIEVKSSDTREATIPIPASEEDTETLGVWLKQSAEYGYSLASAVALQGGSQRDPHTTGLRLKVTK